MSQQFPAGFVYLGPAGYHQHQQQQQHQQQANNSNDKNKDNSNEVISIHGSSSESDTPNNPAKQPPPAAAMPMPMPMRGGQQRNSYHETITIESSDDDDDDDHEGPPPPVRFIQTTAAASTQLLAQQQQQQQAQAQASSSFMMHANAAVAFTPTTLMLAAPFHHHHPHHPQLLLMQGVHAGARPMIVPSPNYNFNNYNNNNNSLVSYPQVPNNNNSNNNNNNSNRRSHEQQTALDHASRRDRQPRTAVPPPPPPALEVKSKHGKSAVASAMDMAPPGLESSSPASDDSEDESSAENHHQQKQTTSPKDDNKKTTQALTVTESSPPAKATAAAAFRGGGGGDVGPKRKRKLFLTTQKDGNDNDDGNKGPRIVSLPSVPTTTTKTKITNKKPKRKHNHPDAGKMVRCPLCFHQVLEEHVDDHLVVCGKTTEEVLEVNAEKEQEEESSTLPSAHDNDSSTEQCSAKPLGNIASLSSSTNMDDDDDDDDDIGVEEISHNDEKKPAAKSPLHHQKQQQQQQQQQQQLKPLGEVNSCSSGGQSIGFSLGIDDDEDDEIMKEDDDDDDDGGISLSTSSSVPPAVRSKRLAMKRDNMTVWRKRVEDTLRDVRQKRQASKELMLKKAIATKNDWMSRMRRGSISTASSGSSLTTSQGQETFPLLPSAIDTSLDSSYMKDQDYPLPRDDFTTIFLDRHFSNVDDNKIDSNSSDSENNSSSGNDKEDDEVIDVDDASNSSSSDASPTQFAANNPEALARKIKEFHLPNRTGVGFEKIEADEDIDKVLESVADIVDDTERLEIHEYLAVLLEEPVARIQKRYEKLNKKPESMRLHDTTYENVMSSFRDLFCRRCLTFDCNFHGLAEKRDPVVQAEIARFKETSGSWQVTSDDGSVINNNNSNNRLETALAAGGIPPMCFPVATSPAASSSSSSKNSADTTPNPTMPDATLSIDQIVLCQKLYHIFDGDLEKVSLAAGISQKSISDQVELEPFQYRIVDPSTLNEHKGKNNKSNMYNPQWIKRIVEKKDHPYFNPCQHEGFCKEDNCTCVANGFFCTKACLWGPSSRNFFRGCNCIGRCMAKNCPCFASNRECDPDLCNRCGACSDPPNQPATTQSCRNDNISMRRHVHLLMCKSKVAGWGLCSKHPLKKGDYIQEYLGEMIPHNEAERRGAIYDQRNQTYLFDLSTDCAVDALRKGNKTRFINHSPNPNIMPTIKVVNGDFRIAFFAKRDIPAESELFFDYGRMFFSSQGTFASKPDDNPSGERIKSKDMFAKSNR